MPMLATMTFDPAVVIALVVGVAYVRAERRVRRERGDRRFPRARGRQFLAGLAIVLIALESPIDTASATSFSVHMVQHLLLTMVAAPLLVLGAPVTLALLSCSPANRRRLRCPYAPSPSVHLPSDRRVGRILRRPVGIPSHGALRRIAAK